MIAKIIFVDGNIDTYKLLNFGPNMVYIDAGSGLSSCYEKLDYVINYNDVSNFTILTNSLEIFKSASVVYNCKSDKMFIYTDNGLVQLTEEDLSLIKEEIWD